MTTGPLTKHEKENQARGCPRLEERKEENEQRFSLVSSVLTFFKKLLSFSLLVGRVVTFRTKKCCIFGPWKNIDTCAEMVLSQLFREGYVPAGQEKKSRLKSDRLS